MNPAVYQRRRAMVALLLCLALGGSGWLLFGRSGEDPTASDSSAPAAVAALDTGASTSVATAATEAATAAGELDGSETVGDAACTLTASQLVQGASGDDVRCLQTALKSAGLLKAEPSGDFDIDTVMAVKSLQEDRDLFVDGIVGRETAISLGIWRDETLDVVRTPAPPPETIDSTGYYLSSVASMGKDAPPLPENSGTGRRIVYSRAGQRVWAVDEDGRIVRSYLVSGSKFGNEVPGTHHVYSKSERTTAWNGKAYLYKMIRYYRTDIGHIGFHAIPRHVEDGSAYQTDAELGTRLSGGCQRQADLDAAFLWAWADVGTKVVVV